MGLIAVIARVVRRKKAAFGDAPGQPPHPPLLSGEAGLQRFPDEGVLHRRDEKGGHEVFKHRPRPGGRRHPAAAAHQHSARRPVMGRGDVPHGGLIVGCHPRFAHQQIIIRIGEHPLLRVEAHVEQRPLVVIQKAQVRRLPQGADQACQRPGPLAAQFFQALLQRRQAAKEVAAVHGGDIFRRQRRQGAGIVPVIQTSVIFWQGRDGFQRGGKPVQHLLRADQPQVPRRHHADEVQADIGGGGAPRRAHHRGLLPVVRRQVVLLFRHGPFVVAPCGGGEGTDGLPVPFADLPPAPLRQRQAVCQ